MPKKLNLSDIKKENKIYEQKQKVELSDEYFVNIYPNFSPKKVSELIKEMITDRERAEEIGIDFDEIPMGDWSLFNIVYKFTDLGIPSDIKSKVLAFNELINYEHYGKIIAAFPQESLIKLQDMVNRFNENLELLVEKELEGNTKTSEVN